MKKPINKKESYEVHPFKIHRFEGGFGYPEIHQIGSKPEDFRNFKNGRFQDNLISTYENSFRVNKIIILI